MKQPPSVSRTVHYVAPGSADGRYPPAHRAAIITELYDLTNLPAFDVDNGPPPVLTVDEDGDVTHVGLAVLNPTGIHFRQGVPYDPGRPRCSCGQDIEHPVHTSAHPDSHDVADVKVRYMPGTWHWPEFVPPRS